MIVHTLEQTHRVPWLNWLSSAETVHQHIGWHPITYWLGRPASLFLSTPNETMVASLLVSTDRLGVAWLHLFASDSPPGTRTAWKMLWPAALATLQTMKLRGVWVMTTQSWLINLLQESGFSLFGNVVALMQHPLNERPASKFMDRIEFLQESDLPRVEVLDHAAFHPPWQMDINALKETLKRSALSTLLRSGTEILGYQMAVPTAQGIHLTRLAVEPRHQGQGIGRALTTHLLNYFHRQRAPWVTVNTQDDNHASFRLYQSLGFQRMGDVYPVFYFPLGGSILPPA